MRGDRITALILTLNEELHLERCILSVRSCVDEVVVVDSYSTDKTIEIARRCGARVVQHKWVNYATQFNWGLTCLADSTGWVLRIDADEYIDGTLSSEIKARVSTLPEDIDGVYLARRMKFQGKRIKYGGVFPIKVIRIFRLGRGRCEERWMDEHIKVSGKTVELEGELLDDNLNSLSWWIDKHNSYASREAVDLLNLEFAFLPFDTVAKSRGAGQDARKRWVKESVYSRLPLGARALLYFVYRYFLRAGFLDGREGTSFHFLQGFWYRYLVDAKVAEVRRCMEEDGVDALTAIRKKLGIEVK
ncbi:glycosyltransferase family 2 protein [Lentisalinibacter sediminis]|uniref:glycosyltransferase family 2 protein n=1 Tax=Lentisalinibacter sediminis TaxID=2992237 RepID=UPI00386F417D